jgi:lipoic acid synthetase
LKLKHAVITSVTRDDLVDGGANHFAQVVRAIRSQSPNTTIELLIPDLKGETSALSTVVNSNPDIINHNIETVPSLYPTVRPSAVYVRSLELLNRVKSINSKILTKSGIMLGLGEIEDEVIEAMKDLRLVNCDILTLGQYLAPSKEHHPIIEYVHPDLFKKYKEIGMSMGFTSIASAPLVRSSYHAEDVFK